MATATFNTGYVQISSVFFRQRGAERRFESYPRRLVYAGREYVLAER